MRDLNGWFVDRSCVLDRMRDLALPAATAAWDQRLAGPAGYTTSRIVGNGAAFRTSS